MPRKHTFILVVLLGAAVVAGLLAMTRTAALGSPATTSPADEGAISFRMQELDRLEASLRKQLEAPSSTAAPAAGFGSSVPSTQSGASASYDDHEYDGEDGKREHTDGDHSGYDDDRDD